MNSNNTILQNKLKELRENQQKRQEQIKMAFNTLNNIMQQFQILKSKNKSLKVIDDVKPQINNVKVKKQQKVYKEKNLFKRFVTQIVFRNIMKFLSNQDLKQLRVVSVFTNQLVEMNIEYLMYQKIQRTKYIESLNIQDYQQPKILNLRNVSNSLRRLIQQSGKRQKVPQQLLSYFTLFIDLYAANKQSNKKNEYKSKYDLIYSVFLAIQTQPLNWYGFVEKERRMIKKIINTKYNNLSEWKEYDIFIQYLKNLLEFTARSDYQQISDAYNKDQILLTIQKQQKFLTKLQLKIKAKQNYLWKISNLGNTFFKQILSYCQFEDIIKSRFVCKKFNEEFQQNQNYHIQIQIDRIQKQINQIQTNFNLSQSQDDFLYKSKDQYSLMELFYSIQQSNKIQNNIDMKDFLQINSKTISDIIFKSQIENELHQKSREQVRECLGIDILVESNYETFQIKLEKVKECLMEYYYKLPQLQKKLLKLEIHQIESDI